MRDSETSLKNAMFYKLQIVHPFSIKKKGLKSNIYAYSIVKLASLKQLLRMIKERVKIKGSKRSFHNLVEIKGSMKSQTNVKRVSRLK